MTRRGGKLPAAVAVRARELARYRCGYCICTEALLGMTMEFDHLTPQAAGGATAEENIWLACRRCNGKKGPRTHSRDPQSGQVVPLFNPRRQVWGEHFGWSEDGTEIVGRTAFGRATVSLLGMNSAEIVVARRLWVSAGWWPPGE